MSDARGSWLGDVQRWVTENVEALDLGPKADIAFFRERTWGAVARVETSQRVLFFKAQGIRARLEPALVNDLARHWPGLGPDVLAVDAQRGWLLLADHGTPMSGSLGPAAQVRVFEQLIGQYARVQRESSALIERWIAAGAPDRRVANIPKLLERLLVGDLWGALPLRPDQYRAIEAILPDLVRVCDQLAATPFAAALDHCDMHGGNVLIGRGSPRLIDWGDACITHPFCSLFVAYQHAVAMMPPSDRRGTALRLRDIYLDAWSDLASATELRTAFASATWLGYLIRALSFAYMLDPSHATGKDDVARFLIRWTDTHLLLGRADELVEAIAGQTE
ncbi:MAG TPA: phosphotransferase [Actinocrinis sp.]|jgi:hypothetical protein|uniref:phosphotransferase n=1 Tax=Actinocrinis sp. TaxID=1920516 RepID=UPI002DDCD80E|nr:phosphotransferase [Actinocrinis sp.]HEV3168841.1 phosphotransferase [Actinocrinis sp.]